MTEISFLHVFCVSLVAEALRGTILNPMKIVAHSQKAIMGDQK
jgi:hypothetical protein